MAEGMNPAWMRVDGDPIYHFWEDSFEGYGKRRALCDWYWVERENDLIDGGGKKKCPRCLYERAKALRAHNEFSELGKGGR